MIPIIRNIPNRLLSSAFLRFTLLPLSSLLFAGAAHAQDLTVKAPPQTKPIAIVGATVHTVSGETIENGYVLFDKGLIKAVGKDRPAASGAEIVEARGKHI